MPVDSTQSFDAIVEATRADIEGTAPPEGTTPPAQEEPPSTSKSDPPTDDGTPPEGTEAPAKAGDKGSDPPKDGKTDEGDDLFEGIDLESLSDDNKAMAKRLQQQHTKKRQADAQKVKDAEGKVSDADERVNTLTEEVTRLTKLIEQGVNPQPQQQQQSPAAPLSPEEYVKSRGLGEKLLTEADIDTAEGASLFVRQQAALSERKVSDMMAAQAGEMQVLRARMFVTEHPDAMENQDGIRDWLQTEADAGRNRTLEEAYAAVVTSKKGVVQTSDVETREKSAFDMGVEVGKQAAEVAAKREGINVPSGQPGSGTGEPLKQGSGFDAAVEATKKEMGI